MAAVPETVSELVTEIKSNSASRNYMKWMGYLTEIKQRTDDTVDKLNRRYRVRSILKFSITLLSGILISASIAISVASAVRFVEGYTPLRLTVISAVHSFIGVIIWPISVIFDYLANQAYRENVKYKCLKQKLDDFITRYSNPVGFVGITQIELQTLIATIRIVYPEFKVNP